MMDFAEVIKILTQLLKQEQPQAFDSSWIRKRNLEIHNFIRQKVRNEIGDIDWDRVTFALPRKFQKLWSFNSRGKREFGASYSNPKEI